MGGSFNKFTNSLLGGSKSSPKVDKTADIEVEEDQKKAAAQRSRLLATAGGIAGEELDTGSTTKRDSIFGNA